MEKPNNTSLILPTQRIFKPKLEYKTCIECNRARKIFIHEICHVCHKAKSLIQSGNKVIDDFIRYTQTNNVYKDGKIEFVPYDKFKDIEFIAEGGFSKVYKATWTISKWSEAKQKHNRISKKKVVLKELNNSKNIDYKELNEVRYLFNKLLILIIKYTLANLITFLIY
jgi:serine/threonine protein kinase